MQCTVYWVASNLVCSYAISITLARFYPVTRVRLFNRYGVRLYVATRCAEVAGFQKEFPWVQVPFHPANH